MFIRSTWPEDFLWMHWFSIDPFEKFKWLLLLIIPGAPLVLEAQGYYARPFACFPLDHRLDSAQELRNDYRGSHFGHVTFPRCSASLAPSPILFGFIGFLAVYLKEELLRLGFKSQFAQSQMKEARLLVGTRADTVRMAQDLKEKGVDDMEVVA